MRAHDMAAFRSGRTTIWSECDRPRHRLQRARSNNFDAGRATASDVMTEGIHCCREDMTSQRRCTIWKSCRSAGCGDQQEQKKADGPALSVWVTSATLHPAICCPNASRAFRPITDAQQALPPRETLPGDAARNASGATCSAGHRAGFPITARCCLPARCRVDIAQTVTSNATCNGAGGSLTRGPKKPACPHAPVTAFARCVGENYSTDTPGAICRR